MPQRKNRARLENQLWAFPTKLGCWLVKSDAHVDRLSQEPVLGPGQTCDLRDEPIRHGVPQAVRRSPCSLASASISPS
jgi:hypothetical protein